MKAMKIPTLEKVVREIKSIKEVEGIYLFGSHARGKAKPISDIDICVITKPKIPEKIRTEILINSSRKIDTNIFWDLPVAIQYRVIKEGKILFKRHDLFLHRIAVNTVNRYLDFKPVLERYGMRMLGG